MKLRDIVVKKAIIPTLAATKRDDAIRELMDALVDAGKVSADQRDGFVKSIIARENRGSTGFGHGVAVPHAKSPIVQQLVVAVGISRAGVEFNALDK
jgi:mannitol/fructose-specific phosphotransferase system IIA component (Ntr-type)